MDAAVRSHFAHDLKGLEQATVSLGEEAQRAIRRAMESLRWRDLALARGVVEHDRAIDERRWEIEERATALIATQQPAASDLRTVLAIVHIVTELERIADHGEGIARISLLLDGAALPQPISRLEEMAALGIAMTRRSLEAFLARDVELAREVCAQDDTLDALYEANHAEVFGRMLLEPQQAKPLTYQLWTSHNLERIGDRATNICERVAYLVTGRMTELNVSRY